MTGGLAVILGETGRNLGAGMSGGTAYVLGLTPEKVNADSLASGELQLHALGEADIEILRDVLTTHRDVTDSVRAAELLNNFDEAVRAFVKVLPRDYAAVLSTRQAAVDQGLDPDGDETWHKILEVTGG
jgi:glutamate synthase (NADPH/NADH) large chain